MTSEERANLMTARLKRHFPITQPVIRYESWRGFVVDVGVLGVRLGETPSTHREQWLLGRRATTAYRAIYKLFGVRV